MDLGNRSSHGEKQDEEEVAIDVLEEQLRGLKAERTSLQSEVNRLREVSTSEEVQQWIKANGKSLPSHLVALSERVSQLEERCILHRTAGWTVFEMDLDVGRRERMVRQREGASKSGKAALGLGVRLDTFYQGQFFEPYYLVFAKAAQMLEGLPEVTDTPFDLGKEDALRQADIQREGQSPLDGGPAERKQAIRLVRHTIPHFIPLPMLVRRFLDRRGGYASPSARGGLDLLAGLLDREGLDEFLIHLHGHLQAYVSRREQARALRSIQLPGRLPSSLEALGNDGFDQIVIRWDLPTVTMADVDEWRQRHAIELPPINVSRAQRYEVDRQVQFRKDRKRDASRRKRGTLIRRVQITLRFNSLEADSMGQLLDRQADESASVPSDQGTSYQFGTVKVEHVRSTATHTSSLLARQQGLSVARMSTLSRSKPEVVIQTKQRTDCERLFALPNDRNEAASDQADVSLAQVALAPSVQQILSHVFADWIRHRHRMDLARRQRFTLANLSSIRVEPRPTNRMDEGEDAPF